MPACVAEGGQLKKIWRRSYAQNLGQREIKNNLNIFTHVACVAEGGQAGHLVRLLELREERVKATEVSLVFTACTTLLTRVARSPEPHLGKLT